MGDLLILLGFLAVIVAIICLIRPIRAIRISTRRRAVFLLITGVVFCIFGGALVEQRPSDQKLPAVAASQTEAPALKSPAPKPVAAASKSSNLPGCPAIYPTTDPRCHPAGSQAEAAPAQTTTPPPPHNQIKVCKAFSQGAAEFKPLQQAWNKADRDSNGVSKTLAQDDLKQKINTLWTTRNQTVLSFVPSEKLNGWLAKINKLDMVERDYGKGSKRYIEIAGVFDCPLPITFRSEKIEATPERMSTLGKLKTGSVVILDGTLLTHDLGQVPLADAIQWGGILWGPFGGLWGDNAFNNPAFKVETTNIAVP